MQFSIESNKTGKKTHCSVQEFTSIEGSAFLPNWIMRQLQLVRDDEVTIKMTSLVNGTRAKFKINTTFSSFQNDPVVSKANDESTFDFFFQFRKLDNVILLIFRLCWSNT